MQQVIAHILPLNNINGAVDLDRNQIFLSSKQSWWSLFDSLFHELAHLWLRCHRHTDSWFRLYQMFGGKETTDFDRDRLAHELFADDDTYLNIGNISGIQNILVIKI